ncbi:unnamed protein product [Auanema sp. JU1783]|nr:unnamed protein product [Auanema sp. JU1783]
MEVFDLPTEREFVTAQLTRSSENATLDVLMGRMDKDRLNAVFIVKPIVLYTLTVHYRKNSSSFITLFEMDVYMDVCVDH